jgi:hypothetical protein
MTVIGEKGQRLSTYTVARIGTVWLGEIAPAALVKNEAINK